MKTSIVWLRCGTIPTQLNKEAENVDWGTDPRAETLEANN